MTYVTQYVHLKVHRVVDNIDEILNPLCVNSLLITGTFKILIPLYFLEV